MAYIHKNNYIHRDLALRNLLATEGADNHKYTVKVSDFVINKQKLNGLIKLGNGQIVDRFELLYF